MALALNNLQKVDMPLKTKKPNHFILKFFSLSTVVIFMIIISVPLWLVYDIYMQIVTTIMEQRLPFIDQTGSHWPTG